MEFWKANCDERHHGLFREVKVVNRERICIGRDVHQVVTLSSDLRMFEFRIWHIKGV